MKSKQAGTAVASKNYCLAGKYTTKNNTLPVFRPRSALSHLHKAIFHVQIFICIKPYFTFRNSFAPSHISYTASLYYRRKGIYRNQAIIEYHILLPGASIISIVLEGGDNRYAGRRVVKFPSHFTAV